MYLSFSLLKVSSCLTSLPLIVLLSLLLLPQDIPLRPDVGRVLPHGSEAQSDHNIKLREKGCNIARVLKQLFSVQLFRVNISSSISLQVLLVLQVHNIINKKSFLVHPISVPCPPPASQNSIFFLTTTLPFSL